MRNTKTKRVLSAISVMAIIFMNTSSVFAVKVGEISVSDTTGNVITTPVNIDWDGNYGGSSNGSGSISGIKVTAKVEPIINMKISKSLIDLGVVSGITGSGTLNIEVGSNSPTGVTVKAKSQNGGLSFSGSASSDVINNTNGGVYTFSAENGGGAPSGATFPNSTAVNITSANQEVNIYSNLSPENLKDTDINDITFKVTALAQTSATAGHYEDFITFTVISNF